MALFGFAINFNSGATDYVLVSADTETAAAAKACEEARLGGMAGDGVESVVRYDAEAIVEEQYKGCAVLGTEWGGLT